MQSAGRAAAQREQPTHFSSPFSWTFRRWRPRKRGYTGRLYSGYCCVIGFLKTCLRVTPKPLSVFGITAIGLSPSDQHHEEGRRERVERRDGQQHLPPEPHQLVVAQPRQRRAQPDEGRDEDEQLEDEPERPERVELVDPREVPA